MPPTPGFPTPAPHPIPRSRGSQALVGALCFALLLLIACSVLLTDPISSWPWGISVLVVATLWWVLRRRTRSIAERSARTLDERELTIRNAAAWWGFTAATSAGCLAALALLIMARLDLLDTQTILDRSGSGLLALMITAATVPTMIIAATTSPAKNDNDNDTYW